MAYEGCWLAEGGSVEQSEGTVASAIVSVVEPGHPIKNREHAAKRDVSQEIRFEEVVSRAI